MLRLPRGNRRERNYHDVKVAKSCTLLLKVIPCFHSDTFSDFARIARVDLRNIYSQVLSMLFRLHIEGLPGRFSSISNGRYRR